MNTKRLPWISRWLEMTQDEVLDKFQGINGSYTDGDDQNRFVFIEGWREKRALLVAHADTVWPDNIRPELNYIDGVLFSTHKKRTTKIKVDKKNYVTEKEGMGIGADDRAGCGILWQLRDLGHSLLIVSGEEQGCIGSNYIVDNEWWRKHLNTTHCFAVEFDRRGKNDLVFYDVATNAFANYVKKETGYIPKYSPGNTDIKVLSKLICAVNMSVGYYDEHSPNERLVVNQFLNTLDVSRKWLSKDIELFEQDFQDRFYIGSGYTNNCYHSHRPFQNQYRKTKKTTSTIVNKLDESLVHESLKKYTMICPLCQSKMLQELWYHNDMKCLTCSQEVP